MPILTGTLLLVAHPALSEPPQSALSSNGSIQIDVWKESEMMPQRPTGLGNFYVPTRERAARDRVQAGSTARSSRT